MIADVYGMNVKSAECGEGPAYGAAALGAVACGAFSTVESVCEKWIRFSSVTESDKSAHGQYIKMYELYSKLYPSLKDVFPVLGKVGK